MRPTAVHSSASHRARGFTLIEMLITVAVIGILAAIAYPSYRETVNRSRRSDAKAVLLEDAQWLERQFTVTNKYTKLGDVGQTTMTSALLPVREAPKDSSSKNYDISFAAGSPTTSTFVLQAVPKGSMADDKCGTLTLSNSGVRGVVTLGSGTVETCWDK